MRVVERNAAHTGMVREQMMAFMQGDAGNPLDRTSLRLPVESHCRSLRRCFPA
jgi:hypothetical protein